MFTLVIGHKAERGIGMVSPPGATGAAVDILRQVLLECGKERRLADFTEDFLQENFNKDPLVPEPGCSEPTFAGSSVDVSAIASDRGLFNGTVTLRTGHHRAFTSSYFQKIHNKRVAAGASLPS